MSAKSQSILEYLMNYGWAILMIAVAALVAYQLGFFEGSNFTPSVCIAQAGFTCSNPIINQTGYVAADIGNGQGTALYLTGVGCSQNDTVPPIMPLANSVYFGPQQTRRVSFYCLGSQQLSLGAKFSGTLWLQYNTSSGLTGQIADIAASTETVSLNNCPGNQCIVPLTFVTKGTNFTTANSVLLTVPYHFNYYICSGAETGADGTYITSETWNSDIGGIGYWAGTGHQLVNTCGYTVGPGQAIGCGGAQPVAAAVVGYGTTRQQAPTIYNSISNTLTYPINIGGSTSIIVISAGGTDGIANVVLPSPKCKERQFEGTAPSSYVATCEPLNTGSYTVSYTANTNTCSGATTGDAYISVYEFPP